MYIKNIGVFMKETTHMSNAQGQKLTDFRILSPSTSQTKIGRNPTHKHSRDTVPTCASLYWPRLPCAPPFLPHWSCQSGVSFPCNCSDLSIHPELH